MPRFLLLAACSVAALAPAAEPTVGPGGRLVFHVDDFGAAPDGQTESGDAIRAAIAAAQAAGKPADVVLSAGAYRVSPPPGQDRVFNVENAQELRIRGAGKDATEVIVTEPRSGVFAFMRGREIEVSGLSVDHDPVPFSQGTITAVDAKGGAFELRLEEGQPRLDQPWFTDELPVGGRWGMLFVPGTSTIKPNSPDFTFVQGAELLEDGTWRLQVVEGEEGKLESFAPGDRWVQLIRPIAAGGFFFWLTEDSGVRDVAIHASHSIAVVGWGGARHHVVDSCIRIKPGTDRAISTNADGWHFQQVRGGPLIEGTYIEGICDDAIAINNFPARIVEAPAPDEIVATNATMIHRGDRVLVFNPREGVVLGEATVLAVEEEGDNYRVRLNRGIEGVTPGEDLHHADQLMNMSLAASGFVVRGNTFRMHRRHAVFVQGNEGIIEGNDIRGTQGLGIIVNNEPDWPVGPIPHEVVIRDNHIESVGNDMWYTAPHYGAGIKVRGTKMGNRVADTPLLRDIQITGNTIIDPPGSGIYAGAVEGLLIEGNRVVLRDRELPRPVPAIHVENCLEAVVRDNVVEDPRGQFTEE